MNTTDRDHLLTFMEDVQRILGKAFANGVLPEYLSPGFSNAWSEARDRVRISLESGEFDHALENAGLTGQPLAYELFVFKQFMEPAMAEPKRRPFMSRLFRFTGKSRRKAPHGKLRKLFARALKGADVILGSFAQAIPGAEGLKQIKESLEVAIAD
jgi:hypothetical protein